MNTSANSGSHQAGSASTGRAAAAAQLLNDPHAAYEQLREQAPATPMRAPDGTLMWIVTRYDDVRTVLGDPRFANNPATVPGDKAPQMQINGMRDLGMDEELIPYLADTLLDNDAPDHARLRKVVTHAFTARRVAALRPWIEGLTEDLLDALPGHAENGVVDFLTHFAYPLPITVICELVGVAEADRPKWLKWSHDLAFNQEAMGGTLREIVDYTHALVERRRADPTDDLLSALIRTRDEDGDRLSDRELVTLVLSLVIAGHDTTANQIANGVWALLTHPDQRALLHEHPDRMPEAVQELLRWCGPVLLSRMRYVTEDMDLGWARFTAGDVVMAVLSSANHDPRQFADPSRLDVDRCPAGRGEQHVSFGSGSHYCLGAGLARLEVETALGALLRRHPDLALGTAPQNLAWLPLPGMRKLARLPLILGPTAPGGRPS
ncbi:cytochrome P450 [Embleya sp. NBC_00896]|uniref:cytochrome P450 family protein n=1 Tax=Embleya sp. NBC_00896 TaxID=2975961 RepID=UPI00386A7909|nr:cytochrome P450 [Embleya sp. NBC_00896]